MENDSEYVISPVHDPDELYFDDISRPMTPVGRILDSDDDSDWGTHGDVTHDTSSFCRDVSKDVSPFYWHGSSPSNYRDPFQPDNKRAATDTGDRGSHRSASVVDVLAKVIVIGDPDVGKTSMIQRYINHKYMANYKWTIGVDFTLKQIRWSENINVKLQLWDIAGQERFTSMTRVYYKNAAACIIMFDLTQRSSFLNAVKWKRDLDQKCQLPEGAPVPCLLLANKCDLESREVGQIEVEAFAREHHFRGWTETSVKLDLMVDESIRFIIDDIVSRYICSQSVINSNIPAVVRLTDRSPENKSNDCLC